MGIFEKAVVEVAEVVEGREILEYIPQRAPMVMVDRFYGIEDRVSVTGLTVADDTFFCEDGVLNESGVIEHIAQSAAVRAGYECKAAGKEVALGYIGAVEKLTIHRLPLAGEVLHTEITHEYEVMNITLVSAVVTVLGQPVAECKMKIYLEK